MNFTTKTLAAGLGLVSALGAGTAIAQNYGAPYGNPQGTPYSNVQRAPYGRPAHQHHFGALVLIKEEMKAGRISRKEGDFLVRRIHEMRAQRREERQAYAGQGPQEMPSQVR
ncbi:MAG TPA: hypothetical protein VGI20_03785 [Rhizomicrobium sp.]